MSTWAIGDLQGCHDELQVLLRQIHFNPAKDCLWFTGDLVSRGPKSLQCLRFVKSLGTSASTVLGNHDLHLLAALLAGTRKLHPSLQAIADAKDCQELLHWLRHQPLLHYDAQLGYCMVHAGLPPAWDLEQAATLAHEVEQQLAGSQAESLLASMYGDDPAQWQPDLQGSARLRYIINAFTRIRYVAADGSLLLQPKGAPGSQPADALPWFEHPQRKSRGQRIIFGHWSTLGQSGQLAWPGAQVWGMDSGCVWGGALSALCLESGQIVSQPCPVPTPA